jgi:hypothetical protein
MVAGTTVNLDVSTDDFLSAERGFTYADLYAILENGDTIAWLTPRAAVVRGEHGSAPFYTSYFPFELSFNVDGKKIYAWAHSSEALSEIVDVVLRLLAASVVHSVILRIMNSRIYHRSQLGVSDGAVPKSKGFSVAESRNE